jgi:hypothetical protein
LRTLYGRVKIAIGCNDNIADGLACFKQGVCRPSGQGCPAIYKVGRARRNPSEVCHAGANERPCDKQDKADALRNKGYSVYLLG